MSYDEFKELRREAWNDEGFNSIYIDRIKTRIEAKDSTRNENMPEKNQWRLPFISRWCYIKMMENYL